MKEYISKKENTIGKVKFLTQIKKEKFSFLKKDFDIGIVVEFRDKNLLILQSNGNKVGNPTYNCFTDYMESKKSKSFDVKINHWALINRIFVFSSGVINPGDINLSFVTDSNDKMNIINASHCSKNRTLLLAEITNVDNRVNLIHHDKEFFSESEMSIEHGIRVVWSSPTK